MADITFTGDGTTTVFNLPEAPASVSSVLVDGTASAYTRAGAAVTFEEAPADGANIQVEYSSKYEVLRALCGLDEERMPGTTLDIYIQLAADTVLHRLYPHRVDVTGLAVPDRYAMLQCQIANEMVLRRGSEGETSHDEDGVNRDYENAGVSASLLKQIVPSVHVLTVGG